MLATERPRDTRRKGFMATILVLALVSASCGGTDFFSDDFEGVVVDPPLTKPPIVLRDTEGNTYDFIKETEGKVTLLYFGYLNCPDVCPVHLAQLAEVFDQLPAVARESVVVFISVDPERDTPDKIRQYLDAFDSRFVGLTGTLEEVQEAQRLAMLPIAQFVGEGDDYTVNHAASVFAFAPDGLGYTIYPFGTRQSQWKNDLQLLVKIRGPEGTE